MSPEGNSNWLKIVLFGDSQTQFMLSPIMNPSCHPCCHPWTMEVYIISCDINSTESVWMYYMQFGFTDDGCWCTRIANHFVRRCDVVNRGFSGYNTRWFKLMLPSLLSSELISNCVAVVIFLGSNDANLKELNEIQHVPRDEYENNLVDMAHILQGKGVSLDKLIFVSPPAVDSPLWHSTLQQRDPPGSSGHDNSVMGQYAEACKMAATHCGVAFVDLYSTMMADEDYRKFVNVDGLHLAKEGSHLLSNLLIPELEKRTRLVNTMFPDWASVDYRDPAASFTS